MPTVSALKKSFYPDFPDQELYNISCCFSVRLDDGQWNQVVIDNLDGYMKVIVNVDNEPARNSYKKLSLQDYSQNPFIDGKYGLANIYSLEV